MSKATKFSKYSCIIICLLLFIGIVISIAMGHSNDNIRPIGIEETYSESMSLASIIGMAILIIQIIVYGFSIIALLLSIIQTLSINNELKQMERGDKPKDLNDKRHIEEQYQIKKDSLKYYIILFIIVSALNGIGQISKCF